MFGVAYIYTSLITILFIVDENAKWAEIRILYNPDVEWHESFLVVLEDYSGVAAGENTSAVINILDTDVTGGLVLPAVPVVGLITDNMCYIFDSSIECN